jgi:hypothetical protein
MPPSKLEGILRDLCCLPSSASCTCDYQGVADEVWDYVLEEAAKAVEAKKPLDWDLASGLLRAMKTSAK